MDETNRASENRQSSPDGNQRESEATSVKEERQKETEAEIPYRGEPYPEDEVEKLKKAVGELYRWILRQDIQVHQWIIAAATVASVIATVVITCIYWSQLGQMTISTDAAKSAADSARQALEIQNRPWIAVAVTQDGPLRFGPYGAGIDVQFHMKNVGHTPSIDTRYHASIVSLPQKSWVAVEMKDAEKRECDSFSQYFPAGSPKFLPAIFPNEEPPPAPWPASIQPKGLQEAIASKSQGPFRHDGYVSLYLVACVVYRNSYSQDLHRSAYGFDLGIPKGPGMWMQDLKPEGTQPDVRLIFVDSFAD